MRAHGSPVHAVLAAAPSALAAAPAVLAAALAAGLAPGAAGAGPLAAQDAAAGHPGKPVYDRWCAGCHGVDGDGNGPAAAWMLPRPRDFTRAAYQIRTTPSGQLPTDADILRVIDEGMPGTAMPGWKSHLSQDQREALVDYLKSFSRFFAMEEAPAPIEVGRAPGSSAEAIERGRELYRSIECWKCHGQDGHGDGPSAPTQTDDGGLPIRPADLAENWHFNGGGSVEDIYTRLRTGLDGTPMPSFADLVDAGVITDDQLWELALFVRSLSPDAAPEVRDVVRAALVDGDLPATPGDDAWADVERYYVPLVGQIVEDPRWFTPAVDGVWVQAVHDGESLAVRLVWHDPSESPDPAWEEWRALVARHVEPATGADAGPPPPDAMVVQFPSAMPDGRELPYFLGGDAARPVYRWHWSSDADVVEEVGRGLDETQPLRGPAAVTASADFEAGVWRLVLRRPLDGGDDGSRLSLPAGAPIPVAFFARDGSSGETGARGSMSSWYYLYLDTPTAATVYVLPIAATLLTALLGLAVVARARRAGKRATERQPDTLLEGA